MWCSLACRCLWLGLFLLSNIPDHNPFTLRACKQVVMFFIDISTPAHLRGVKREFLLHHCPFTINLIKSSLKSAIVSLAYISVVSRFSCPMSICNLSRLTPLAKHIHPYVRLKLCVLSFFGKLSVLSQPVTLYCKALILYGASFFRQNTYPFVLPLRNNKSLL